MATGFVSRWKIDAFRLVQGEHAFADRLAHDARHRNAVGRDDMNRDVALAQGRGDFEADEARADHDALPRSFGIGDERVAIGKTAQQMHMRERGARHIEANGFGPGRNQQRAIAQAVVFSIAVADMQSARGDIDPRHARRNAKIDLVFGVKVGAAQRQPIGLRLA